MKVCDIVSFNKESYFTGAVQTEWFYEDEKNQRIAESYVFHGPKYYGVSETDVKLGQHRLIDTASFAKTLAEKMYSEQPDNYFIMTIAGYGTGKSHLAVSLGALFSGNSHLVSTVTENIAQADADISEYIHKRNVHKNLVIALNGMNNFNLDSEVLKCARLSLEQNGLDDTVLKHLTKSYEIAKHFVERTFNMFQDQFEISAKNYNLFKSGNDLKEHLVTTTESDKDTLAIINDVYKELNGDRIHWDRGISAGDILTALQQNLCGTGRPFNKLLILFDEFGRYIEYAAANPTIAGEASLQQIFESIQSAEGKIIFVGFIQNQLDAYLSRIDKTSNIIRYVGRYKGSENLFLSSNFETILSNLITKIDPATHERVLDNALNRYEKFHYSIESSLNRWDKATVKKSVWTMNSLYKSVVLKGCYPLHPITVWLLSNMHNWMQQRSAITFASEMVDRISNSEIQGAWLPYIYPINLIDSSIFDEMLNSEEKGLVQSQFCMLYRDILIKVGNKLSDNEINALQAILIVNIGRFSFFDQEDAITAIRYCSNLKEEEVRTALKSLENLHGVIVFDENANTYDLVAEASGFNEFKRIFTRYWLGVTATIDDCTAELKEDLSLGRNIETSFAQKHHIASIEWEFERKLINAKDITEVYLNTTANKLKVNTSGESVRGMMIYAYCESDAQLEIERIAFLFKKLNLDKLPIITLFLDDREQEVLDALKIINSLKRFSVADSERFQKHIHAQFRSQNKKVCNKIISLVAERKMIDGNGLHIYSSRLNALCSAKFEELYHSAPPFMFDGFEKKTTVQAKRYLTNICIKLFDRTLMNVQSYQALTQDEKNRVKSSLSTNTATSWQVFDDACNLVEPQNKQILTIYNEVSELISYDTALSFKSLFGKYMDLPYGMNENAIALFAFYFIAKQENAILSYYGQEKLTASHLSDKVFKQGKLQHQELLKIRIQKNANMEVDFIAKVCNDILMNTSVEKYELFKTRLAGILAQEDVSTGNQLLVAQAKMRLDETLKQKSRIYSKLSKAQEYFDDAQNTLVIHRFINVFECLLDTELPIAENLPFSFSEEFKQAQHHVRTCIDKVLNEKYLIALDKFNCKITQLSQVKSLYKNVVKVLKEQGYQEFALRTESKIKMLEQDLIAKQKYDSSIIECQKEISLHSEVINYSYKKCIDTVTTLSGWMTFFSTLSDLPNSIAEPIMSSLSTVIMKLEKRLSDIQADFATCMDEFECPRNASDLRRSEASLKRLLALEFDEKAHQILCVNINDISTAMSIIELIPDNLDDIIAFDSRLSESKSKACWTAIRGEISNIQEKYYAEQTAWVQKYLEPLETNLCEMDAFSCANWMEKTKALPSFLDHTTTLRYKEALDKVEAQQHSNRIQGVVSMFNNLTEAEKVECIRIICSE